MGLASSVYKLSGDSMALGSGIDMLSLVDHNYNAIGQNDILSNLFTGIGYQVAGEDYATFLLGTKLLLDVGISVIALGIINAPVYNQQNNNTFPDKARN